MPFIVLEGLDGAGKSTQVKMLQRLLAERGIEYEYLHFPRFTAPLYGELIASFLRGELGSVESVDPRLVALIYAGDRAEAAQMIRGWLEEGKWVIVDRYVYSNVAYQCAKIADTEQRNILKNWIVEMEYGHNKIPRPDVSLFLDVPFEFTCASLTRQREGDDRDYLKGKSDIHEASLSLQQMVREVYLAQAEEDKSFIIVACSDQVGGILPAEDIFTKIKNEIDVI